MHVQTKTYRLSIAPRIKKKCKLVPSSEVTLILANVYSKQRSPAKVALMHLWGIINCDKHIGQMIMAHVPISDKYKVEAHVLGKQIGDIYRNAVSRPS